MVSPGEEGVNVDPKGERRHEREQVKNSRRQSEAPGEEIKSPKMKIIRVQSEETQDDMDQEGR